MELRMLLGYCACLDAFAGSLAAVPIAMRLVAGGEDVAGVREPIKQGRGHFGVTEDTGPFAEVQVGGDDHAGALVELAQQVKEQGTAAGAEGQIAHFVEDDQIHAHQAGGEATGLALRLLEFATSLTEHAYRQDFAAKIVADNMHVLLADAGLPPPRDESDVPGRRANRTATLGIMKPILVGCLLGMAHCRRALDTAFGTIAVSFMRIHSLDCVFR